MIQNGAKVIETYNKQLEAQNIAKLNQIEKLKKQMDLLTLSTHLQALNSQPQCQQCIRKQQQIDTLIKAIKSLRNASENTKFHTNDQNSHLQVNPQRENEHQKVLYLSDNQALLLTYSRESISREQSKQNFSTKSNQSIFQKLQEQNSVFLKQISKLQHRLQQLQKKIYILQQTNRTLREQTIKHNHKNNELFNQYGLSPLHKIIPQNIIQDKKRVPVFSTIRSNVTKNVAHPEHLPTISSRSHFIDTTITTPVLSMKGNEEQLRKSDRYKSPLDVFTRSHQNTPRKFNLRQEDLIQQRKRSLNHKIKILQGQNRRLRTQITKINN